MFWSVEFLRGNCVSDKKFVVLTEERMALWKSTCHHDEAAAAVFPVAEEARLLAAAPSSIAKIAHTPFIGVSISQPRGSYSWEVQIMCIINRQSLQNINTFITCHLNSYSTQVQILGEGLLKEQRERRKHVSFCCFWTEVQQ